MAAAISFLAIYHWFRWRPFALLRHPISLAVFAFITWAFVRELADGQPIGRAASVVDQFRTFGFILLWAPLLHPPLHRRVVIYVIGAGLVLFSVIALSALAVTGNPFHVHNFDPTSMGPALLQPAYALFVKRSADLGGPILVAAVFGAAQMAWDVPRRRWLLSALAMLGALALLYAIGRRTSHVAFAMCALLIVLMNIRRPAAVAVSLVGVAMVVIGLLAASPVANTGLRQVVAEAQAYQATTPEQRAQLFTSTGLRLQYWSVAARVAMESPLVGSGLASFPDQYQAQATALSGDAQRQTNPHNEYLYIFCTLGVIGLLLYLGLQAAVLHNAMRLRNDTQRKVLCLYMTAALTSLLFNSMVVDMIPGHFHALAVLSLGWFEWDSTELAGAGA